MAYVVAMYLDIILYICLVVVLNDGLIKHYSFCGNLFCYNIHSFTIGRNLLQTTHVFCHYCRLFSILVDYQDIFYSIWQQHLLENFLDNQNASIWLYNGYGYLPAKYMLFRGLKHVFLNNIISGEYKICFHLSKSENKI